MLTPKPSVQALFTIIAAVFLVSSSCNEAPTNVGMIDPSTSEFKSISSDTLPLMPRAKSYQFKYQALYGISPDFALVGSADSITSFAMLRFVVTPDSLRNIQEQDIFSAQLHLALTRYAIGDTLTNRLAFDIFPAKKSFGADATIDSIMRVDGSSDYFDKTVSIGTFDKTLTPADTALNIDLDKTVMAEWFRKQSDSVLRRQQYGLVIFPRAGCSIVKQLRFIETSIVDNRYVNSEAVWIDLTYKRPDSTDTMKTRWDAAPATSFSTDSKIDSTVLAIQGSVSYRMAFEIDVSSIPRDAFIHESHVQLSLDSEKSKWGTLGVDSLINCYMKTSTDSIASLRNAVLISSNPIVYQTSDLKIDIEKLLRISGGKGELVFQPTNSKVIGTVNRLVFHGLNDPDKSKKPKLSVLYSTRPKF